MALKIITNTVWRDSAVIWEETSGTYETVDKLINVTGGQRYLQCNNTGIATGASTFDIYYVNKSGGLDADTVILTHANEHATHGVTINSYATFGGGATSILSDSNFAGANAGNDYILEFTEKTNQQALEVQFSSGTGGSYIPIVTGVILGSSTSLSCIEPNVEFMPEARKIKLCKSYYEVTDKITFTATNLTKAEIDELENQYNLNEEPFFIYDDEAAILDDSLWHVVMPEKIVIQEWTDRNGDSGYSVQFKCYRLREYNI